MIYNPPFILPIPNVLSKSYTIPATYTLYVPNSLEISNGVSLEVSNTSWIEIG